MQNILISPCYRSLVLPGYIFKNTLIVVVMLFFSIQPVLSQNKTRIDLVIGYAPSLEAKYGVGGVNSRINAFINLFNLSFDNSKINACVVATHLYKSRFNFTQSSQFVSYKQTLETQTKRASHAGDLMIFFADENNGGLVHIEDSYSGSSNSAYALINFNRTLSALNTSAVSGYVGAVRATGSLLNAYSVYGYCYPFWPPVASVAAHSAVDPSCTGAQHPVWSGPGSSLDYPVFVDSVGKITTGANHLAPMGNASNNNAARISGIKNIVANFRANPTTSLCPSDVPQPPPEAAPGNSIIPILNLLLLGD